MSTKTTDLKNLLSDSSLLETRGYLAGNWVSGDKNQTFDVVNPARGDTVAQVANLSREQISAAIDSAYEAQKEWAKNNGSRYSRCMLREFAQRIPRHHPSEHDAQTVANRVDLEKTFFEKDDF